MAGQRRARGCRAPGPRRKRSTRQSPSGPLSRRPASADSLFVRQQVLLKTDARPAPFRTKEGRRADIMIGDPRTTLTGTHRFRIECTRPPLGDEETLVWDAVGAEWDVPVGQVEVPLAAPYTVDDADARTGDSRRDRSRDHHRRDRKSVV